MKPILTPVDSLVSRSEKERFLRQEGIVIWFTGLSGAGKSTLARLLERQLFDEGHLSIVLDGDNIRQGICNNLGFSAEDRLENIRRVAELSKLFLDTGVICINAFISPRTSQRNMAREIIGTENFLEVYLDTPLEVCELRDVKGLYKRARSGEISRFTGISDPYEAPVNPEITINTADCRPEQALEQILTLLRPRIRSRVFESVHSEPQL